MKFVPFIKDYLPKAAELLAKRHLIERKEFLGLPDKFEDYQFALKALNSIWNKKYTEGIAAFKDKKLVGYIIGHVILDSKFFDGMHG